MDGTREGRAVLLLLRPVTHVSALLSALLLPCLAAAQIRPIELEGFIVTGTPIPIALGTETSHVTVLNGEELRRRGTVSVSDVLAEVPGVSVVRNGSFGGVTSVFLRGAEGDQVKILVDGVEVGQAGGAYDLAGLLVSDVERIEVSRGPASALYGSDALAGVIQVFTRRGRGPIHGSLLARAGSYGRLETSASVAGGTDRGNFALSLTRDRSNGVLDFNNRSENSVISGTVTALPDDRTRLRFSGRYGNRTYHFPTDGAGNVVDRNAFSFGDETSLAAEAFRQFGERVELRAVVTAYDWDGGSDDRPDGPADTLGSFAYSSLDAFRRGGLDLRASLVLPAASTITAGMELEGERQRSFSESLSDLGSSTGQSRFDRSNRGYYAHLVSQHDSWLGTLGGRIEDNEQYGRFFTYQAGLSYTVPGVGTRLRGSVGRGLKEPTFLEASGTGFAVGNPDLRPERSLAWEMGLEQSFGGRGASGSLTWYHQSMEDLIQYTFSPLKPGGPNYYNVAEALAQGVEAEVTLPLGPVRASGGYTFLRSRVVNAGFDQGEGALFVEGRPLIRRPRHQGSLDATYAFGRGKLSAGVSWVGARSDRDFGSWPASPVELSGYTLLRMGAEVAILEPSDSRPGLDLQVSGENLLDESYQQVFGFDAPGRAILLGGRLSFGSAR